MLLTEHVRFGGGTSEKYPPGQLAGVLPYDYFIEAGGFAAVPFSGKGGDNHAFDDAGLHLCQAGLAMPCTSTFMNHRGLVSQRQGRYGCPLLYLEPTDQMCPINHKLWPKGGCVTKMGISPGARVRYLLNRHSPKYIQLYNQRSATERVNSQAVELGIERPRLRNQCAIANQNTLIYILINLRALQRLLEQTA